MRSERLKRILFDKPDNIFILMCNIIINLTWVFTLGYFINKSIINTLIIMVIWTFRLFMGKAKHYKSPLQCFLLQAAVFSALFLSTYINIYVAAIFTIFSMYLLSGYADIKVDEDIEPEIDLNPKLNDLTLYYNNGNKRETKYQALIDFVRDNPTNEIILEYEEHWKKNYVLRYDIFKMFFRARMSYNQIKRKLEIKHSTIIRNECKIVYASLEIPLKLNSLRKSKKNN